MGKMIPFGAIPASSTLPDGIFQFRVVELKATQSSDKDGRTPKKMFKLTAEVVEPATLKGQRHYENFVIGTDDDPDADLLETWTASIGGKNFKRFSGKLAVPVGDEEDEDAFCELVKDQEFLATIVTEIDDGKKDAKYKGNVRNKVSAYWAVGEKTPALTDGSTKSTAKPKTTAAAGNAKANGSAALLACNFPECGEKLPKGDMPKHVQGHMAALQAQQAAAGDDE